MPKSIVNESFEFDDKMWVISLLNSESHSNKGVVNGIKGALTGHSVILIEGARPKENSIFMEEFIRQCDIQAELHEEEEESSIKQPFRNVKGNIVEVRIKNTYYSDKTRYKCSARSWLVTPEEALKMLKSIEMDQSITKAAALDEQRFNAKLIKEITHKYIPYEYAGRFSLLGSGADNCPTWCLKHLKVAGIDIQVSPADLIKTMPQKHVGQGAETIEYISGTCSIV